MSVDGIQESGTGLTGRKSVSVVHGCNEADSQIWCVLPMECIMINCGCRADYRLGQQGDVLLG